MKLKIAIGSAILIFLGPGSLVLPSAKAQSAQDLINQMRALRSGGGSIGRAYIVPSPPPGPTKDQLDQKDLAEASDDFVDKGNKLFKSSEWGQAVAYYRKALDYNPENEDATHNLKIAQEKIFAEQARLLAELERQRQAAAMPPSGSLGSGNTMVVDATNVRTGLPREVEDSLPATPAGDRVRKGFQAVSQHDWKVALAWFQDALNKEPSDPGLKRLVSLAQFTLDWRDTHHVPAFGNPEPLREQAPKPSPADPSAKAKADNAAASNGTISDEQAAKTLSAIDKALDNKMGEDLSRALNDFNLNYLPKHPDLMTVPSASEPAQPGNNLTNGGDKTPSAPPPAVLKSSWQTIFDSLLKPDGPNRSPRSVSAVRD